MRIYCVASKPYTTFVVSTDTVTDTQYVSSMLFFHPLCFWTLIWHSSVAHAFSPEPLLVFVHSHCRCQAFRKTWDGVGGLFCMINDRFGTHFGWHYAFYLAYDTQVAIRSNLSWSTVSITVMHSCKSHTWWP